MKLGWPSKLIIETASVCNLRCPSCAIGLRATARSTGKTVFFPLEKFQLICDEAAGNVKTIYLHLWGEPTLHPKIQEFIEYSYDKFSLDFATHGQNVDISLARMIAKCACITISCDGITQETYQHYRVGGSLSRAMRAMELLADMAGDKVCWVFVVWRWNEHEVEAARELARKFGVRFHAKSPGLFPEIAGSVGAVDLPLDPSLLRYDVAPDGKLNLRSNRQGCREFWDAIYVLPDGAAITCCYDWNASYSVGNVFDSSLWSVWTGPIYTAMRERHLTGNLNLLCERQCKLPI